MVNLSDIVIAENIRLTTQSAGHKRTRLRYSKTGSLLALSLAVWALVYFGYLASHV